MKPQNLNTRIFLDSSSVDDTKSAMGLIGFLDGQTTNPSYFAKSREVQDYLGSGRQFTKQELISTYKNTIQAISTIIPNGAISIEVYADSKTMAEDMLKEAREMFKWIPNAYIKLPIIPEGIKAAQLALSEGLRVNMTLCFSQEQAAVVYTATKGAKRGDVFVSPFIGRHTDNGADGLDLVKNIIKMYSVGDGHVEVLTASLRSIDQLYAAIQAGTDIITVGMKYIKEWAGQGLKVPGDDFVYSPVGFSPIQYKELDIQKDWEAFNIKHAMTDAGLKQFVKDWNSLIKG